ncbi:MAG: prepilin-type N-terminal cleavage/methylation domain-containing protein [Thermodesulfovibrionales bacterium]
MKQDGFTLIELLITIGIMFILAAIAVPGYIGQQRRADRVEAYTNLDGLRLVEEQTRADTGTFSPSLGAAGSTNAVRDGNWNTIRSVLPRWQPGPAGNLKYSYRIIQNACLPNNPAVPLVLGSIISPCVNPAVCFTAVATGIDGTRVAGDIFAVDCNNNKNY